MIEEKYPLPPFLTGRVSKEDYQKWLHRKALAHAKRDSKRTGKKVKNSNYKEKIHAAVMESKGLDFYTGKPLAWKKISKFNSKTIISDLPTIDHNRERNRVEFKICAWKTNQCKSFLTIEELTEFCKDFLKHRAKTVAVLLMIATLGFSQQTELVKTYFDPWTKTQLSEVYSVIKNTPTVHGNYKSYNKMGTLIKDINYTKGKMHGQVKKYNDYTGKIEYDAIYQNGNAIQETEYYSNGKKSYTKKIDGAWIIYDESGTKRIEAILYEGGKWGEGNYYKPEMKQFYMQDAGSRVLEVKKCLWYYEDGTIAAENIFDKDYVSKHYKNIDKNGKVNYLRDRISEYNYKETYFTDGKKIVEIDITPQKNNYGGTDNSKSIRNGAFNVYDANGNIIAGGKYETGIHMGKWKLLYAKDSTETYEYSKAEYYREINFSEAKSKVTDYYITGEKKWWGVRTTSNFKPDGECISYFKNGNISSIENYKNGVFDGICKYFYENGQIQKEQKFAEGYRVALIAMIEYYLNGKRQNQSVLKNIPEPDGYSYLDYYDWIYWYENGNKQAEGMTTTRSDGKCFSWKYYSQDGMLEKFEEYDKYGELKITKSGKDAQDYIDKIHAKQKAQAEEKAKAEAEEKAREESVAAAARKREEEKENLSKFRENCKILGWKGWANENGKLDKVEKTYIKSVGADYGVGIKTISKKNLYKAYEIVKDDLTSKMSNNEVDLKSASEASTLLVKVCEKMLSLNNESTDELEKKLKKATKTEEIISLLGL